MINTKANKSSKRKKGKDYGAVRLIDFWLVLACRLIFSHIILFILPVEHYSLDQPNSLNVGSLGVGASTRQMQTAGVDTRTEMAAKRDLLLAGFYFLLPVRTEAPAKPTATSHRVSNHFIV